jgi:hypothetical protein
MGVHLLRCAHGNENMGTQDVIHDTFATTAWDVNFHLGCEQLHTLLSTMFHSSHKRIDIMFTKNGICTLADVVIVDPTQANLFCWSYATWRFAASKTIQATKKNYHD